MSYAIYEKFWGLVKRDGDSCWIWKAGTRPNGYGRFFVGHRAVSAHRYSCSTVNGPIPSGFHVHHKCENKLCVNPSHLVALSPKGHALVSRRANSTHCGRGHELSGANVYVKPNGNRNCRSCRLAAKRRYRVRVRKG